MINSARDSSLESLATYDFRYHVARFNLYGLVATFGLIFGLMFLVAPVADAAERQDVSIANDSTTRINIRGSFDTIDSDGVNSVGKVIYKVPRGKRLLIEYSSVEMDANISNPDGYDFSVYTYLSGAGPQGAEFLLGTLVQGPNTSRGPPYFSLGKATPIFFHHTNTITLKLDNKHASVDFTFARVTYAFSCRLVDAR